MNIFYKLSLFTFLTILINLSSIAQNIDLDKLKGIGVRSIGPAGMSGRITAIDVVHDNPQVMYVGSASGGLWKSESGGVDWTPIFDDQKILSIGAVAIQQDNPDVIWVGTGEGNPRNSSNGGYGLYKSMDGGKSWELMGLEKTRNIHRIRIDPKNPNTVYVGAIGSPWGEHPERGVYKTTDGGKTWTKSLFVDNKTGVAELIMDPNNPNKLFAAMWEHRRKPWTFTSGGPGSGLYMTVDGGNTWKELTSDDGLPKGDLGRIGIAISKANSKTVYALIESKKNALYKSEDGGYTWKMVNDNMREIGNRPFYYAEIYADPSNENRIYSIFTYVNVSEDGGKSFKPLMPAYGTNVGVHPDHHAWYIHPDNPDMMLDGNDGGLNITYDGGETWRFVQNLPVGQFYHINVDNEYPYNVYGGMQDNGSWFGPAYVWKAQGIRNAYFQEIAFGDGFDVVPDPDDSRFGFAQSQQGYVQRYDRETGKSQTVRPTHPDKDMLLRFNWNAAIAQNPFDNSSVYFGSQFVHKTTDKGQTWEIISPDLTTNNPEKQKQFESGGLTYDATGAENNTTITAIAPSSLIEDVIWVGTDDGNIQITQDGGENWTKVSKNIKNFPAESWVAQIQASTYNPGEAFVVVNNYRNFDFKPYLFHTTNYGKKWTNLTDNDEVWTYALSVVQDPEEPNLMFLGTDGGLYFSINKGQNWQKWTNNYPNAPTRDLVIHPREHDLVIGTFGRAIYIMDDIRPLRELAAEGEPVLDQALKLFTPPTAYQAVNQQASGTRFGANAMFNGENRNANAMISYLINRPEQEQKEKENDNDEEEKDEEEKVTYDELELKIYNRSGELIRTLKQKTPKEDGLHRMYWRMDEAGQRGPTRRLTKEDADERGGIDVLPGKYKLVMHYGIHKDSTYINVKFDPRIDVNIEDLKSRYDFLKSIEKMKATAYEASQRILKAKETADHYIKWMKEKDKTAFKEDIKASKAIKDSLEVLFEPFVGEDYSDKQGIIRTPVPDIGDRIRNASYYASASFNKPGKTQLRLKQQAEEALKPAIEALNKFFAEDWIEYQKRISALDLSLFETYKSLEIKK
ncbi:VPS10 domain-containing protein [Mesohalobacter halotolerans]|uniref:Sortilin N-terminal domain-containing protein n=1 Tax=Mesohalobacter halotolerans TaxID=1883405 RepID=A0A4U5TNK4_9FLAO|nr:exo-alpha-sialidase [Mesohalobacter halotolerans]TKS55577.1 hypothetical protein FCN74_11550 [Mesohalobacter halotolerans]